jgi:hypothetical protein
MSEIVNAPGLGRGAQTGDAREPLLDLLQLRNRLLVLLGVVIWSDWKAPGRRQGGSMRGL